VDAKRSGQQKNRTAQAKHEPEQKETMAAQATGGTKSEGQGGGSVQERTGKKGGNVCFSVIWKCSHSFTQSFSSAKYLVVVSETAGKKAERGEQSAGLHRCAHPIVRDALCCVWLPY
jgi:hypothetical protein